MKSEILLESTIKALQGKLTEELDKPISYKFIYYLNNATAERRETTYEDIRNDWKTATSKCESDLAAFEYFYTNILDNLEAGLSTLDSFYQEYGAKTDDEKLKAFDDYFSNVDIGEGETILIKIQRSGKTIWDSEITKQDLLY